MAVAVTNDTDTGSSTVKYRASVEVPWSPYQLQRTVLVCVCVLGLA